MEAKPGFGVFGSILLRWEYASSAPSTIRLSSLTQFRLHRRGKLQERSKHLLAIKPSWLQVRLLGPLVINHASARIAQSAYVNFPRRVFSADNGTLPTSRLRDNFTSRGATTYCEAWGSVASISPVARPSANRSAARSWGQCERHVAPECNTQAA